jgi:hypothetical protein
MSCATGLFTATDHWCDGQSQRKTYDLCFEWEKLLPKKVSKRLFPIIFIIFIFCHTFNGQLVLHALHSLLLFSTHNSINTEGPNSRCVDYQCRSFSIFSSDGQQVLVLWLWLWLRAMVIAIKILQTGESVNPFALWPIAGADPRMACMA